MLLDTHTTDFNVKKKSIVFLLLAGIALLPLGIASKDIFPELPAMMIIFDTLTSLPVMIAIECIAVISFIYLCERFPIAKVPIVIFFGTSYLYEIIPLALISKLPSILVGTFILATLMIGPIQLVIFWKIKTLRFNHLLFTIFFSLSLINTILFNIKTYHSPVYYITKDSQIYISELIDNIQYHYPKELGEIIRKLHQSLPQSHQLLHADVRVLERDVLQKFWKDKNTAPSSLPMGFTSYNISGKNKVVISNDDDLNRLKCTIAHELTHVQQMDRFGPAFFLRQPLWKIEGEASYVGNNCSQKSLIRYLNQDVKTLSKPFRFGILKIGMSYLDYEGAQLQSWYYLEHLQMSQDEFYSSSTTLAPWDKVKTAFLEKHSDIAV